MADLLACMRRHVHALYRLDDARRIVDCNRWDGGGAPRFHLGRTTAGNVWVLRNDVPDAVADALQELASREPPWSADPQHAPLYRDRYLELLSGHAPVESIWAGPAYRFPWSSGAGTARSVAVTEANARVLHEHMGDWLPDVPFSQPFRAVLVDGHAVSVCASVRISTAAHEAGVETSPAHRRSGHAADVVRDWARDVRSLGAEPLYSTSWGNAASRAVAAALDLQLVGADFHVR